MEVIQGIAHRRPADYDADYHNLEQNFITQAYHDWPNEAGFEGLTEQIDPVQLKVKGTIPSWASGSLFRTGPSLNSIDTDHHGTHRVSHWFDGFAHTHRFDISSDGSAHYSSRRQSQARINDIKKRGWQSGITFAQRSDPCVGMLGKVTSVFRKGIPTDADGNEMLNTSVLPALNLTGKGTLHTLTDGPDVQRLDPKTLEPIANEAQKDLHSALSGQMSCAHPQHDPETGDWFNYNLNVVGRPTYRVFKVDGKTGKAEILATIAQAEVAAAYIHSFFLTQSFIVLCVPTSHFSMGAARILWERNLVDSIKEFDPNAPCRWIVIDRKHGRGVVDRFTTPASFFFHSVNSFEEATGDGKIKLVLECVTFRNLDVIKLFYYDNLLNRNGAADALVDNTQTYQNSLPTLTRFSHVMAPKARSWKAAPSAETVFTIKAPHAGDLPTINEAYATKKHRYVYSISLRGHSLFFDCIIKTDTETGEARIWSGGKGHSPSEAIFVARPDAKDEDDGVLLSVVLDSVSKASYLLVLDAKTLEEVARAEADFAIAFGLHGVFGQV